MGKSAESAVVSMPGVRVLTEGALSCYVEGCYARKRSRIGVDAAVQFLLSHWTAKPQRAAQLDGLRIDLNRRYFDEIRAHSPGAQVQEMLEAALCCF